MSAPSGGKITAASLLNDTGYIDEPAFTVISIDYDRFESCSTSYTAAQVSYFDVMFDAKQATDAARADCITLIEGAAVVGALAGVAAAIAAWGTLGYYVGSWAWDHSDSDGDGVLNKDDKYPYDKDKSFRYPPWLEGWFSAYVDASQGQTAIDLSALLLGKFVNPATSSIDSSYAKTVLAGSKAVTATNLVGTSVKVTFLN